MATSYDRAQDFNREAAKEFFDILETEIKLTHFAPDRIYCTM